MKIIPLLVIIASVGMLSFLLISSTAPFNTGLFDKLNPKTASNAAANVNVNLGVPTNLVLTSLDSTIRANWTPSTDTNITWQVFSVWHGNMLMGTKVLSPSTSVADGNGLTPGQIYTIRVQSMDRSGALSNTIEATATTDPQSPMKDAAFFENFNDTPPGPLNPNYFDVRTSDSGNGPQTDPESLDKRMVFADENHWHSQVVNGPANTNILVRSRVPMDWTKRTLTAEFEVDVPPVEHSHGQWWVAHITKDIPPDQESFGNTENVIENAISFTLLGEDATDPVPGNRVNRMRIDLNINGVISRQEMDVPYISFANVRVPVVIKINQNAVTFTINGDTAHALTVNSLNLPFTTGWFSLGQREYFPAKIDYFPPGSASIPTMSFKLQHWDNWQFDGPTGSYNPVVKTYLQPGCPGQVDYGHNEVINCPEVSNTTINIPDDISKARSAILLYNINQATSSAVINGHTIAVPATPYQGLACCYNSLNQVSIPTSWLIKGANNISLTGTNTGTAFEIEVVYNIPRTIGINPEQPTPRIGIVNQNFRADRVAGGSNTQTVSTVIYNFGSTDNVSYTATSLAPWISITSPTTGSLVSPAKGGSIVPLTMQIDFSKLGTTTNEGEIGLIKITGGVMPIMVGILATNDGSTSYGPFFNVNDFVTTQNNFNKDAIPYYHGDSTPSLTPSPTSTPTLTAQPTPTPTPTPSPHPSTSPNPCQGADLNHDGKVDLLDYSILVSHFNQTVTPGTLGDINNNGVVDLLDYSTLVSNFGKSGC